MPKIHFSNTSESQYYIGEPFEKSSGTGSSIKVPSRDKATRNIGRMGECLHLKKTHIAQTCNTGALKMLDLCKSDLGCKALKSAYLSVSSVGDLKQAKVKIGLKIQGIEKELINKICEIYTNYINIEKSSDRKLELYYGDIRSIVNEIESCRPSFENWFTKRDLSLDLSDDESSSDESSQAEATPTVAVDNQLKLEGYTKKILNNIFFILNASEQAASLKEQIYESYKECTHLKENNPESIEHKDALQRKNSVEDRVLNFANSLIEDVEAALPKNKGSIVKDNYDEISKELVNWFFQN